VTYLIVLLEKSDTYRVRCKAKEAQRLKCVRFNMLLVDLNPGGDSGRTRGVRVCGMRPGVTLSPSEADLEQLRSLVKDRNEPQKHVWRAQIVLLSAGGVGTNHAPDRQVQDL
jgi:hypothetical protein